MYGHCNLSFTLPSSLRWINRFAQTPIYVFPSFLKICCAPLVEGPLDTNTSSASFMVSLAILQVYVLAVESLEIAKPRILDSVVAVISSSLIHYISCTSVQILRSIYKTYCPPACLLPLSLGILPLSRMTVLKGSLIPSHITRDPCCHPLCQS